MVKLISINVSVDTFVLASVGYKNVFVFWASGKARAMKSNFNLGVTRNVN